VPGSTLLDLYSLVRQGSPESEALRQQILELELEEPVRTFWQYDFPRDYRRSDLQAPKHKLSTAGCTILGRLDKRDTQYFAKDMCGLVDAEGIMRLKPYEMIVRIRAEVVRCKTLDTPKPAHGGAPCRLVEQTRRKYCRPTQEVRAWLQRRCESGSAPSGPGPHAHPQWSCTETELDHATF